MNVLKSLFWAATLCFVAQAVQAQELTQDSLQKVSEILNPASESFTLLLEKEASEAGKMFCIGVGGGGATGPTGSMGPPGIGLPGPTGATGPAGSGTLIPYASGGDFTLGYRGDPFNLDAVVLGFGRYFKSTVVNGQIDLNAELTDFSFSMPRDGVITSLSADFSASEDLTLNISIATVTAQLYWCQAGDSSNLFTPVPGAAVIFPQLTGNVPAGTTISGRVSGLNIPVDAETRLFLVYTMTANPAPLGDPVEVIGFASAGLKIN